MSSIVSVFADETILGGWSEITGYFQGEEGHFVLAKSKPYHTGRVEEGNYKPPTMLQRRAVGRTVWIGFYHYTRARMENKFTGTVLSDSGRVYGRNVTEAYSPWYTDGFDIKISVGRTYYGQ